MRCRVGFRVEGLGFRGLGYSSYKDYNGIDSLVPRRTILPIQKKALGLHVDIFALLFSKVQAYSG